MRDTGRQGNQADEDEPDKDKLNARTEESDRTHVETNEGPSQNHTRSSAVETLERNRTKETRSRILTLFP